MMGVDGITTDGEDGLNVINIPFHSTWDGDNGIVAYITCSVRRPVHAGV